MVFLVERQWFFSFASLEIAKVNLKTPQITLGGKSSEKARFSKNITGGGHCTSVPPPPRGGGGAAGGLDKSSIHLWWDRSKYNVLPRIKFVFQAWPLQHDRDDVYILKVSPTSQNPYRLSEVLNHVYIVFPFEAASLLNSELDNSIQFNSWLELNWVDRNFPVPISRIELSWQKFSCTYKSNWIELTEIFLYL
jgi:hypothetical protein